MKSLPIVLADIRRVCTPLNAAVGGTVVVAALSFSMSFTALTDLAGWMFPIIIDGLTVVATTATVALMRHRWYAWTLLIASTLVSLAGNMTHAGLATNWNPVSCFIAAMPPLVLLAVTHLTVLLARQNDATEQSATVEELTLQAA